MDLSLLTISGSELSKEQDSGMRQLYTWHCLFVAINSEHGEKRSTHNFIIKMLYKLSRRNKLLDKTPTTYLYMLFM